MKGLLIALVLWVGMVSGQECEFNLLHRSLQTFEFVQNKKMEYLPPSRLKMSIWDALKLVDSLDEERGREPNSLRYYATAEALKQAGQPRWLILVGLIYDLGTVLTYFGEHKWAVEGDLFPVGCAFSPKVSCAAHFFIHNPDRHCARFQTPLGIYSPQCGFDQLHFSWGQYEYLYQVVKDYLPKEAAYVIRYHAFYAAHREGAYAQFMNAYDYEMRPWLALFCKYKECQAPKELNIEALQPYYETLVAEFLPPLLNW